MSPNRRGTLSDKEFKKRLSKMVSAEKTGLDLFKGLPIQPDAKNREIMQVAHDAFNHATAGSPRRRPTMNKLGSMESQLERT